MNAAWSTCGKHAWVGIWQRAGRVVFSLLVVACGTEGRSRRETAAPHTERSNLDLVAPAWDSAGEIARWRGRIETQVGRPVRVTNPQAGTWSDATAWQLMEEMRLGYSEGPGAGGFESVTCLAIDSGNRLYVLDRRAKAVLLFAEDGRYLRTVGRSGAGPGEFGNPIGIAVDRAGRLWVVDPGNARYSVFDTAGAFLEGHRRPLTTYSVPWHGGFDRQGRFIEIALAADRTFQPVIEVLDDSLRTERAVPLPTFRGDVFEIRTANSYSSVGVPFSPDLAYWLLLSGSVWLGVSDNYRLVQLGLGGDSVRVVERPVNRVRVLGSERAEAIEGLQRFVRRGARVDVSRIPEYKPAFNALFVDDRGYVWVSRPDAAAPTGDAIDVFDPLGRYLGVLRAQFDPVAGGTLVVRGDIVYSAASDSLGTPYVVRARLFRGRPVEPADSRHRE
jgi:hypothetical protein